MHPWEWEHFKLMLLANSNSSGKCGKMRASGFSARDSIQPIHDAQQVESGSGQNVLEMGFSQADVARPTNTKRVDGLSNCAFDSGTNGIALRKIIGALAESGGL